jgi:hypothetical protein
MYDIYYYYYKKTRKSFFMTHTQIVFVQKYINVLLYIL